MDGIARILLFMVSCVFTENIVFVRLLGCCALGKARRVETAAGYGLAMTLAMTLAAVFAWLLNRFVLAPLNAGYLQIIVFAAAALVSGWLVEKLAASAKPALAEALSDSLSMIAVNCAVLGIALLNADKGFGDALMSGLFGGLGFLIAVVLMAGVQERLETSRIPKAMKGLPISLVSASLIALAFMGFIGLA